MPWQSRTRLPISHEELVNRLPAETKDSIYRWPLEDLPLRADAKMDTGLSRVRGIGEGLMRLTGLVCIRERYDAPWLSLRVGQNSDFMTIGIGHVDPRMKQLKGLYIDTAVECDPIADGRPRFTSGVLQSVYGVEQPMRKGAGRGVIRGEVTEVHSAAISGNTYGATFRTQGGDVEVQWNPIYSPTIAQEGIAQGSLALMAVVRQGDDGNHYMWHPNNEDPRRLKLEPAS